MNIDEVLSQCKEFRKNYKYMNAIETLNVALAQVADPRLYFSRGITHDLMDRPEMAIDDLSKAIALDGRHAKYLYNRGRILSRALEKDNEAIVDFERAVALEPDHVESHRQCCVSLLVMGRPNRALVHALKALELAPHEGDTHFCLGESYIGLEQFDEAVISFRKAIELDPRQDHYSTSLASALKMQNGE